MPVELQCSDLPLTAHDAEGLWQRTIAQVGRPDESVTVRCVSPAESARLNEVYRGREQPTNVLTFSYPDEESDTGAASHDIALCLDVALAEARERSVEPRDYLGLLLVHAFLHAAGLDHEASADAHQRYEELERAILAAEGFTGQTLSSPH